MITKAVLCKTQ